MRREYDGIFGDPDQTHYIPWFTSRRPGQLQRAACDAWVPLRAHSVEPTCTACQGWLAAEAEETAAGDPF